ncbi:MAG: UDP-glucose 4-epimerase GalE, partial [Methylocystis sp.]|nr:UDP-glucose 4-epimerase GalE [Methylocystis sp.]
MSVLVTGGAGYIGSHMVLELVDAGESVVALDNLSTGFRWAVPENVPLVVGDVADEDLVTETLARHDVDAIIHFAAKIVVPESVGDPLGYYLNNTAKARTLLACAVDSGVRHFIFSSTAAVYGDPDHNPVTEDATLKPLSPYGRSKLMVEWMLADAAKAHEVSYVALRYFNVAGADPKGRSGQSAPHATHLIKVAAQTALGHRPKMQVFGTDY